MKTNVITIATAGALLAAGLLAPVSTGRLGAQDAPKKEERTTKKEQRKDTGKSQEQHKDKSAKKK